MGGFKFFPLHIRAKGKAALLIGGGNIALRKYEVLSKFDFKIKVVSLEILPELWELVEENNDELLVSGFKKEHLQDATIVISATDDPNINEFVAVSAYALGVPVNVVDNEPLCDFVFPALLDRNPLLISITTSGKAAGYSAYLRSELEKFVPLTAGKFALFLDGKRKFLKKILPNGDTRRNFYQKLIRGRLPELLEKGQTKSAESVFRIELENFSKPKGNVVLVGAGPGDPELLTVKAVNEMSTADVVLYDELVNPQILEYVRRDAEKINVGKRVGKSDPRIMQNLIHDLFIKYTRQGLKVIRLKSGDPFIFGRGGEEELFLMENDIPFKIIPGITAALGCAAEFGIPLTMRGLTSEIRFLTAHNLLAKPPSWWREYFTSLDVTHILYMGYRQLDVLRKRALSYNLSPDYPYAVIAGGTTSNSKIEFLKLSDKPNKAMFDTEQPILIILGKVLNIGQMYVSNSKLSQNQTIIKANANVIA